MRNLANSLLVFTIMAGPRWENTSGVFYMQIAPTRQKRLETPVPKCKTSAYCLFTVPGSAAEQTSFPFLCQFAFPSMWLFFLLRSGALWAGADCCVCLYSTSHSENSFLVQAVKQSL